jgi:steroid 5-alpha reductase family enzyme
MTNIFFLRCFFFQSYNNDIHIEQLAILCIAVMLSAAIVCFFVSELTHNYSQVDKLWSIMPVIYSLLTLAAYPSPRLSIMACLVTIWGLRLSFNFYRKGGYNIIPWKGDEDYRWKILRQHPKLKGRIRFGLFNLFFISFYQNLLIMLFSSPLLLASKYKNSSLGIIDIIAGSLMLLFIVIESIADNQMFRFQKLKRQIESSQSFSSDSQKREFITDGLWSFARHPNYASEQAIWISFYFFGVAASGNWINWTIVGPLLLVFLFLGSAEFTERISSDKYPDYIAYKKEVPKFLPRIFKSKEE